MAQVLPAFYESFARGQRDALDFQNTIEEEKRRKAAELRTQEMFPYELEGKRGYNDLQTQYIRRQRQQGDYTEAVQPYQIQRDISGAEAQRLGFKNRAEFERAVAASAAGASAEAPPEMRPAVMRDSLIPSVERGTWVGNYFRPTTAPNISGDMSTGAEYSGLPPYAQQPQQSNIPAVAPGYVDPTLRFPFDSAKALELYDPNSTSKNKSLSSNSTYTSARVSAPNPFGEPITFPSAPQIDPSVPTFYNAPPAETPRRPATFTERYMPETAAIRERTAKPREGASITEELGRKAANVYGYLRAPSEILENALPQMGEPYAPPQSGSREQLIQALAGYGVGPQLANAMLDRDEALGFPLGVTAAIAFQESSFDPKKVNPKSGASGMFQIMPRNFTPYGGEGFDPFDPYASLEVYDKLMRERINRHGIENLDNIFRAYNGPMDLSGKSEENLEFPGKIWERYNQLRNFAGEAQ